MLRETQRRVAAASLAADFVQGDACKLPLRGATMDHVYFITVFGEIPDRRAALAEIKRILRPGGRLSISEQFPDPDFITRHTLRRELRAAGFVEETTSGRLVYTSTWSAAGTAR
jgi:ubiquinone/menaquinone biosynthesis C-methylase UbiE